MSSHTHITWRKRILFATAAALVASASVHAQSGLQPLDWSSGMSSPGSGLPQVSPTSPLSPLGSWNSQFGAVGLLPDPRTTTMGMGFGSATSLMVDPASALRNVKPVWPSASLQWNSQIDPRGALNSGMGSISLLPEAMPSWSGISPDNSISLPSMSGYPEGLSPSAAISINPATVNAFSAGIGQAVFQSLNPIAATLPRFDGLSDLSFAGTGFGAMDAQSPFRNGGQAASLRTGSAGWASSSYIPSPYAISTPSGGAEFAATSLAEFDQVVDLAGLSIDSYKEFARSALTPRTVFRLSVAGDAISVLSGIIQDEPSVQSGSFHWLRSNILEAGSRALYSKTLGDVARSSLGLARVAMWGHGLPDLFAAVGSYAGHGGHGLPTIDETTLGVDAFAKTATGAVVTLLLIGSAPQLAVATLPALAVAAVDLGLPIVRELTMPMFQGAVDLSYRPLMEQQASWRDRNEYNQARVNFGLDRVSQAEFNNLRSNWQQSLPWFARSNSPGYSVQTFSSQGNINGFGRHGTWTVSGSLFRDFMTGTTIRRALTHENFVIRTGPGYTGGGGW